MGDREERSSPFSARGFVFSAVFLGALVIIAIAVVVSSSNSPSATGRAHLGAPATIAGRSRPPASTGPSAENTNGCSLPAGSGQVPATQPSSVWTLVGAMAVPNAPGSYGPQKIVGGIRVCFQHSPLGALYALASYWSELTKYPATPVLKMLAASTPAKAVALEQALGDDQPMQDIDGDPGTLSIEGFSFTDYTASEANISLVFGAPGGTLVNLPNTLLWQDGDWRWAVPPSQKLTPGAVSGLQDFVSWSAAS
jgi:hypothetical protein